MNETISSADLEELHTLIRIFLSDSMNKVNTIPLIFLLIISFRREVTQSRPDKAFRLSSRVVIWILPSPYL